jgi:hypothetical protein
VPTVIGPNAQARGLGQESAWEWKADVNGLVTAREASRGVPKPQKVERNDV